MTLFGHNVFCPQHPEIEPGDSEIQLLFGTDNAGM